MSNSQCALDQPDFLWSYCPSNAAAILFSILFAITTAVHGYQAYRYRKPFALVLIMGGLWELMGYAIRSGSIQNPFTTGLYTGQMLLILLAPLWINAFIYMLMGRMIHFFLEDDRIFTIKARRLTLLFVVFDIIAFLVQGTGGSMTSSTDLDVMMKGLNVYTAGVALQIFFNALFLAIVVQFHITSNRVLSNSSSTSNGQEEEEEEESPGPRRAQDCTHLLYLVYTVMFLILFRNFYRLAEFASGMNNTIILHEWYAYVMDGLPMLVAMVVLNVFHPGRKLQGNRCDFTQENKERKEMRRAKREAKKSGAATAAAAAGATAGTEKETAHEMTTGNGMKYTNVQAHEVGGSVV